MDQYNNEFYEKYKAYITEDGVRQRHDCIFGMVCHQFKFDDVLDLGCGRQTEFLIYTSPKQYIGIDLAAAAPNIVGDYRKDLNLINNTINKYNLTSIVSLFSIEMTAPAEENYLFYHKLFENPKIKYILSSGGYYSKNKTQAIIEETGILTSYQTIEPIEDALNDTFDEIRFTFSCPSKLFGEDVIEVWKLMERN